MNHNIKKLSSIDLNLLTAFEVLDKTRSVTQAAKQLGLSQPAMSHTLSRLRLAFEDQLFVKTPKAMVPTPKALNLAPLIQKILGEIERTLLNVEDFTPMSLERTFHIKTTDFLEALLVPKIISRLANEAPKVKVSVTSPEFRLPREVLEQGACDIAIGGFFGDLPDGFYQQKLFDDDFKCALRKAHPRLGKAKTMSIQEYLEESHMLIAPGGDLQSKLDRILEEKKKIRSIASGCSSYMVAGWVIDGTDNVLTAPSRLLDLLGKKFELKVFPLPVKFPKVSIVQVWHQRNHQDPGHRWFRDLVREILQKN